MPNKTFSISGMTCGGCKNFIHGHLSKIEGVDAVSVDLEKGLAVVHSEKEISIDLLRNDLPSKYKIESLQSITAKMEELSTMESKSKLAQLKPLLLILIYLFISAAGLNFNDGDWSSFMLDFMGLFFIVFSFFKFLDLAGFKASFSMYDPLAKLLPSYGWVYPFIETGLGLMFLFRFEIKVALIITLIVLAITTFGVSKVLLDKKEIRCACLGTALNLPMTEATLIENSIMLGMAMLMLFA